MTDEYLTPEALAVVHGTTTSPDHDWHWGPGGTRDSDDPARRVVVDSEHYLLVPDGPDEETFRGHGGRRFDIAFHDGRTVTTRNLWYQGRIPANWRHRYPDNARFATAGGAS